MLDTTLKQQLKAHFADLPHPVDLVATLDGSTVAGEMRDLLIDLADQSPSIGVAINGSDARVPSFSVGRKKSAPRIRFAGVPMGHEFTSLVLAVLQTAGRAPKLDAALIEQIRELPGDYRFETYVSLSCQNCPDVVQALNAMEAINPRIEHVMIDGAVFQDEVSARKVMAVPAVFLNGEPFAQGRIGVEEILARLSPEAAQRTAGQLDEQPPFDVLVVGGGPAAAIYAARKGIRTGVVTERFGGQVTDTLGIDNFISVSHTEGPKLVAQLEQHVRDYAVDIMAAQRAESLLPMAADGLTRIRLASGATLKARSVVIATGARWREMKVPGEQQYRGKGVCFCPHCDGPLFKGKTVAVIGGGNSGVEAAIDLAGIVAQVTLLEFDEKLRADAVLQKKLVSLPNVQVLTRAQTTEVTGDGEKVTGLRYQDRQSGSVSDLAVDGVFVQIGLLPNTDWLKGTVKLSKHGEIEVDDRAQTSQGGVFAAGDATTTPFKQIIIAMGEGAKASLSAFDYLVRHSVPS